jgi:hypothetical protein
MQNYDDFVRSKGVVVFAHNTGTTDYVAIADGTSRLIAHVLGLPVTLITDVDSRPDFAYDHVVRINSDHGNFRTDINGQLTEWRNFGRYLAYELSPYDDTILLDTDYLVLDDSLLKLFDTTFDYQLMHYNSTDSGPSYSVMGETSLPFVWATVVLFRKTQRARLFFNLVGRIQRNYHYYCALYNVRERNYRNDYAFAIANCILNGYNLNELQSIPWPMLTIEKKIENLTVTGQQIRIYHDSSAIVVPRQNIHIMDKEYLQSTNFKQVVEAICEPT